MCTEAARFYQEQKVLSYFENEPNSATLEVMDQLLPEEEPAVVEDPAYDQDTAEGPVAVPVAVAVKRSQPKSDQPKGGKDRALSLFKKWY